MDKKLENLINKDDINIPHSFDKRFEDTLSSLPNNKVHKFNPYKIAASLVLTLTIGGGIVLAISDNKYKYIPVEGVIFDSEKKVYGLNEPISKVDENGEEIKLEMSIYEELNRARVQTSGEFNIPESEKAELKIGDKVYENNRINLSELDYTWGAIDTFDGIKDYTEGEEIVYTIYTDDENKVDFNISLNEIDGVAKFSDLGKNSADRGIPLTAIINEEEDNIVVDFFTDSNEYSLLAGCEGMDRTFTNIYLVDANGNKVYGKKEISAGGIKSNRVKISTKDLEKPYKLVVPELRVDLLKEDNAVMMSEEIEVKVPKKGESIEINEEVAMGTGKNIIDTDNKKVKLVRGTREHNKFTLEIEHIDNENSIDELNQVTAVKEKALGKDELVYAQSKFNEEDKLVHFIELDLKGFEKSIKFKLAPIIYFMKGNWEYIIE